MSQGVLSSIGFPYVRDQDEGVRSSMSASLRIPAFHNRQRKERDYRWLNGKTATPTSHPSQLGPFHAGRPRWSTAATPILPRKPCQGPPCRPPVLMVDDVRAAPRAAGMMCPLRRGFTQEPWKSLRRGRCVVPRIRPERLEA